MSSKTKPTAVVVIPTYNEAGNIGPMLDYLAQKIFPTIHDWNMLALVSDGNSPDGTPKVVQSYMKKYPCIKLVVQKEKNGIGGGYLDGFKYAKEKLDATVVIEMDADFQHPPEDLPKYLQKIEQGYDYICGSRKIAGGSNPKGWGAKRLFFSEVGGFVARTIMFFPSKLFFQVTDPTTGFKATRVKPFIDATLLDPKHLYSRSFGYKLQFLYETLKKGAKYTEIPLQFGLRTAGESKIEPQTAKEIFLVALKLRLTDPSTKKFLKFGTVGVIGFIINSITLELFRSVGLADYLATYMNRHHEIPFYWLLTNANAWAGALSAEVAIISNFLFNNFWTFRHEKYTSLSKFITKLLQFNFTSLGAICIQFIVIGTGTHLFGDTSLVRQISLVCSIVFFIIPYNWTVYNAFIWKKKS